MKKIAIILLCSTITIAVIAVSVIFAPADNGTTFAEETNSAGAYLFLRDPNHMILQNGIIANAQVGLYVSDEVLNAVSNKLFRFALIGSDGTNEQIQITNNRYEVPVKNGVTYQIELQLRIIFGIYEPYISWTVT